MATKFGSLAAKVCFAIRKCAVSVRFFGLTFNACCVVSVILISARTSHTPATPTVSFEVFFALLEIVHRKTIPVRKTRIIFLTPVTLTPPLARLKETLNTSIAPQWVTPTTIPRFSPAKLILDRNISALVRLAISPIVKIQSRTLKQSTSIPKTRIGKLVAIPKLLISRI